MEELQDYSGRLRPDLDMRDFSKDALVRLWQASGKLYVGLDGLWFNLIREQFGEQKARELSRENWKRETPLEVRRHREAMNIWGEDVESYLKYLQVDIGAGGIWPDFRCEMTGENRGILTIKRCLSLEYFERHGDITLQKHACEVLDAEGFQWAAHLFHPRMKAVPLKLPPRKHTGEIACQWEFRIEA
ncbi:MAG: hypothetical protein FJ012_08100 [Chloroflexi bacterium]|nr:hypothetical protein [Chloroflexota bacterium]